MITQFLSSCIGYNFFVSFFRPSFLQTWAPGLVAAQGLRPNRGENIMYILLVFQALFDGFEAVYLPREEWSCFFEVSALD